MDLKVMRYFVSTVKAGSITKAAATLYVTQPTLTRQIHELEEELGHPLLERSRQGITLTPRGLIFYQRASELLDMATRLKDEVRGSSELSGTIALAAAETPAMQIIARAMSGFIQEHPFVSFDVVSASRDLALPRLDTGLCDLALFILPPDASMDCIDLRVSCPWGLIVPTTHPLAGRDKITPSDLRGLPMLLSKSNVTAGNLDEWRQGREVDVVLDAFYLLDGQPRALCEFLQADAAAFAERPYLCAHNLTCIHSCIVLMCFRYLTVSLWCKSKTKFLVFQQYLPFFPYLCPWTFYKESERHCSMNGNSGDVLGFKCR